MAQGMRINTHQMQTSTMDGPMIGIRTTPHSGSGRDNPYQWSTTRWGVSAPQTRCPAGCRQASASGSVQWSEPPASDREAPRKPQQRPRIPPQADAAGEQVCRHQQAELVQRQTRGLQGGVIDLGDDPGGPAHVQPQAGGRHVPGPRQSGFAPFAAHRSPTPEGPTYRRCRPHPPSRSEPAGLQRRSAAPSNTAFQEGSRPRGGGSERGASGSSLLSIGIGRAAGQTQARGMATSLGQPAAWVLFGLSGAVGPGPGLAALLALGGGAGAAGLRSALEPWFRKRPYRHARR